MRDSLNTPGEWAVVFLSLIISFIITWYAVQYVYSPPMKSEGINIIHAYKSQGCVAKPDFIATTAVAWTDHYKQIDFTDAWNGYMNGELQIVLFCP